MPTRKIWLITEHFAPSHGATAQLMGDLALGLAAQGKRVVVLTATADPANQVFSGLQLVRLGQPPVKRHSC